MFYQVPDCGEISLIWLSDWEFGAVIEEAGLLRQEVNLKSPPKSWPYGGRLRDLDGVTLVLYAGEGGIDEHPDEWFCVESAQSRNLTTEPTLSMSRAKKGMVPVRSVFVIGNSFHEAGSYPLRTPSGSPMAEKPYIKLLRLISSWCIP